MVEISIELNELSGRVAPRHLCGITFKLQDIEYVRQSLAGFGNGRCERHGHAVWPGLAQRGNIYLYIRDMGRLTRAAKVADSWFK